MITSLFNIMIMYSIYNANNNLVKMILKLIIHLISLD